jgi:hypothetical protein
VQLARIQECKEMMEKIKEENPELAAKQKKRQIELSLTEKRIKDNYGASKESEDKTSPEIKDKAGEAL